MKAVFLKNRLIVKGVERKFLELVVDGTVSCYTDGRHSVEGLANSVYSLLDELFSRLRRYRIKKFVDGYFELRCGRFSVVVNDTYQNLQVSHSFGVYVGRDVVYLSVEDAVFEEVVDDAFNTFRNLISKYYFVRDDAVRDLFDGGRVLFVDSLDNKIMSLGVDGVVFYGDYEVKSIYGRFEGEGLVKFLKYVLDNFELEISESKKGVYEVSFSGVSYFYHFGYGGVIKFLGVKIDYGDGFVCKVWDTGKLIEYVGRDKVVYLKSGKADFEDFEKSEKVLKLVRYFRF